MYKNKNSIFLNNIKKIKELKLNNYYVIKKIKNKNIKNFIKNNKTMNNFLYTSHHKKSLAVKCHDNQYNQTIGYHLEELKDRVYLSVLTLILSILFNLSLSKDLISAFEINGLKNNFSFLQLNPGEYFFTSVEVYIFYIGFYIFWIYNSITLLDLSYISIFKSRSI